MKRRKPINYGSLDATFNPKAPEGWFDPFYESPPTGVVVEGDYRDFTARVMKRDGEWRDENGNVMICGRPVYWRLLPEGNADE